MAYQISYDYKEIKKEKIKKMSILSYGIAVLGVVAALLVAQLGGCFLDGLLMEDRKQAWDAVDAIAESIRNGSTLECAIEVFCKELGG